MATNVPGLGSSSGNRHSCLMEVSSRFLKRFQSLSKQIDKSGLHRDGCIMTEDGFVDFARQTTVIDGFMQIYSLVVHDYGYLSSNGSNLQ